VKLEEIMPMFKVTLGIGFANARHEDVIEIPQEELDGKTEEERGKLMDEWWQDWANDYIDGGISAVETN
jgi:hypothetical protein